LSWKLPSRRVLPLSPPTDALTRALGARLGAVAQRVRQCDVVVDVGTDHGRLPIALLKAGMAQHAVAVDIHEEPLAGARARADRAGVSARMTFLLGNGLLPLGERRADVLTIAGVGGALVGRVLREQQPEQYGIRRVVAQPMSEERVLRAMVSGTHWQIVDEALVVEAGRLFLVVVLEHQAAPTAALDVEDVVLGPCLRHATAPAYGDWLQVQQHWLRARQGARASREAGVEPEVGGEQHLGKMHPGALEAPWPTDGTEPELDCALHLRVVQDALQALSLSKE
jgi:tRNA (adenine22-N1)-methyltransferase